MSTLAAKSVFQFTGNGRLAGVVESNGTAIGAFGGGTSTAAFGRQSAVVVLYQLAMVCGFILSKVVP